VCTVEGMPAKVKAGGRVAWRLTVGCRDGRGVVTEVMETMLHGDAVFSYVIELDRIIAGYSELISKYGNPMAVGTKVLFPEVETWQDEGSSTTKVYLEGSVMEAYASARAQGRSCFYAIKLDCVRAVDCMLRIEHPIDLYSDAFGSQAMLWENDADTTQWQRVENAIAMQTAVAANAAVAALGLDSIAKQHASGPPSFALENFYLPSSASAVTSPWACDDGSDADPLDASEPPSTACGITIVDKFATPALCAILDLDAHLRGADETRKNHSKKHANPRLHGFPARKMRWRRELHRHGNGVGTP